MASGDPYTDPTLPFPIIWDPVRAKAEPRLLLVAIGGPAALGFLVGGRTGMVLGAAAGYVGLGQLAKGLRGAIF